MIEENAIRCKESITFSIVSDHPIRVNLGRSIGTPGFKLGFLILRGWRRAEHLAGRGLIETGFDSASADSLEDPRRPQSGHVSSKFGHVKTDPDMALSSQMIDLIRFDIVD